MKRLSDRTNIKFGVVLTYVSLLVSIIGSYFITPVVLNNIGDSNYGLLSFCNSITSWLSLISTSLGSSYIYFATKCLKEEGNEWKINKIFKNLLFFISAFIAILSFASILVLRLLGFKFSNYSDGQNDLILVLFLISGTNVSVTVFFSLFSLYNNYKKSFVFNRGIGIVFSILTYLANLILAITTKSIISIAIISLFSAFSLGILNLLYAIKMNKMFFENNRITDYKNELRPIIKYSSIVLLSSIISNLDSNLDKTLLGAMVNAESVTMYQLSITFVTHLAVVAYSFVEVIRPTFFSYYSKNQKIESNNLFLKICKMQLLIVLFFVGGYIACGYHFVLSWIGEKRISVYFYSSALFISLIVPLTLAMMTEAYRASNKHKISLGFSLLSIIINLFLTIFLILLLNERLSVWACIIGTIVPRVLIGWIVSPLYAKKKMDLPIGKYYLYALRNVLIAIAAIIPSLLLAVFLDNLEIHNVIKTFVEGVAFVVVYFLGVLFFEKASLKDLFANISKKL